MRQFSIRLLTLAVFAAPLMSVPLVSPAKAATSGDVEKNKKKIQKSAGTVDSRPATPKWPPPIDDDFDRKSGGGGGGM